MPVERGGYAVIGLPSRNQPLWQQASQQFPFWGWLPPICTAHKSEGAGNGIMDWRPDI